jgi:hypothetical protein
MSNLGAASERVTPYPLFNISAAPKADRSAGGNE